MQIKALTLGDVLVATATLALLSTIGFIAVGPSQERARQTLCASHLRQIHEAGQLYGSDFGEQTIPGYGTFPIDAFRNKRYLKYAKSSEINYCPDTPKRYIGVEASTYMWPVTGLFTFQRDPMSFVLRKRALQSISRQGAAWPYVFCGVHDELYYYPRESNIDHSIRDSFVIDLTLDGSVVSHRRFGVPPNVLSSLDPDKDRS